MPAIPQDRIAREDATSGVGRRMVVRCLAEGCDHAALLDQRRYFASARDWPREGPSTRFRCLCGSRQAEVRYTRHEDAEEGAIHPAALALWF